MKDSQSLQYFPSNLLSNIFSHLNEEDICNCIPFVCEKWRIASSHLSLSLKSASFTNNLLTSKEICYVLHNAPFIKSVCLASVNDVVPVLRQICRCNRDIEKIQLKNCSSKGSLVPEDVLINVLLSLPHLESIELNNTKFKSHLFFDIVAEQTNITSIDLSLNENVTLSDIMTLVHNCNIQEFKMSRRFKQPEISDKEMSHVVRTMKQHLRLLHLDMRGLGNNTYHEIFCCSKLSDLKLNNAMSLTTELLTLLPTLKKLKSLKVEGPSILRKGDLHNAVSRDLNSALQLECLKLEHLDCLSDYEICKILEICFGLKALSLKGCKALTVEGISAPIMKLAGLSYLNVAFLKNTCGIRNIVSFTTLNKLEIDVHSYNQNNLVTCLSPNKQLEIIQLTSKCKIVYL